MCCVYFPLYANKRKLLAPRSRLCYHYLLHFYSRTNVCIIHMEQTCLCYVMAFGTQTNLTQLLNWPAREQHRTDGWRDLFSEACCVKEERSPFWESHPPISRAMARRTACTVVSTHNFTCRHRNGLGTNGSLSSCFGSHQHNLRKASASAKPKLKSIAVFSNKL